MNDRRTSSFATVRAGLARILVSLAILVAATTATAHAQQSLPRLDDVVTDEAGVLDAGEEAVLEDDLARIARDDDVQLWALYVDSTGVEDPTAFATETAAENALGTNDALLMVAEEDRTYSLWVADGLSGVSDQEIDAILADLVEPELVDGDWAGAAVAAARGLVTASGGVPAATSAPTTPPAPGDDGSGSAAGDGTGGGFDLTPILIVALLGAGAFLLVRTFVAQRRAGAAERAEQDRLARQANTALLALDERLRDAEQELGFAEAQWGEEEAKRFRAAILEATGHAKAAFAVRQRLDDAEPDTPPQRQAMLKEIVDRTAAASRILDDQLAQLARLRNLEHTAPEQLRALAATLDELRQRRAAAESVLRRLTEAYAEAVVRPVAGNLVEAGKAIDGSVAEVEHGLASVQAGRAREAAVAVRRAEEGVARATQLIDAVERLANDIEDARERIAGLLAEVEGELVTARRAIVDQNLGSTDTSLPGRLSTAEGLMAEARQAAAAGDADPLGALAKAQAADQSIDDVLAAVQKAEEAGRRLAASLQASLASARTRVDRATDFITTRRHGVGERARTRAAEAERALAEANALAATDAHAALEASRRAERLADEAYQLAAQQFGGWDDRNGPTAGPYAGTGADIAGAILGGVIGGILSGGGRGSGWGGSPWGVPTIPSGRRSGGFGLPPGPFGGGGRVGGGGFGGFGGGGHARGGRW